MARWLDVASCAQGVIATNEGLILPLLSTVVFFSVCVTMLVALCAAQSNPQVLNRDSEPEGELAVESSRKALSQRFSPSALHVKLSSFRKSSLRNSSFRIDCSQVDVVDALQKGRPAAEEESTGPAVWQRAILRGERCAPLEFSGLILYDEKGNPVPLRNTAQADVHNSPSTLHTN